MFLEPGVDYRYAFKKGMQGTDVAALQINLPGIDVDGVFGSLTKRAVTEIQEKEAIKVDGIAGLMTQQRMIVSGSEIQEDAKGLPDGLLRSLAANESGFAIAAFSIHPSDAGYDVGPYQRSSGKAAVPTQQFIKEAYDIHFMAAATASRFNSLFKQYRDDPFVKTDRRAWELAVLSHNWPSAAQNLASIGRIYKSKPSNVPEDWIEIASGGRLKTADEWVKSYIEKATVYVNW